MNILIDLEVLNMMKTYKVNEVPLKVHGRTTDSMNPITLFYTASAVELNIAASELWMSFFVDYSIQEMWIAIVINDMMVSRQMLLKGETEICIFRNMNRETIKNIKIVKEVQAMAGDPNHILQISHLKTDGVLYEVPEKEMKIEFIGDSITSGEGAIGAKKEEDWISMFFTSQNHYAKYVAEAFDADYHIISQSGWGVYSSWDNNPHATLPSCYEQVCGLLKGHKDATLGVENTWDFTKWQPKIVVINLGTNDASAFDQPAWIDENEKSFKQHRNEDGSYNEDDQKRLIEAMHDFLVMIRKNNLTAHIVWVYGMLGHELYSTIQTAIKLYSERTSDTNVSSVLLPDINEERMGARWHPGIQSHKDAAKAIIDHIKKI